MFFFFTFSFHLLYHLSNLLFFLHFISYSVHFFSPFRVFLSSCPVEESDLGGSWALHLGVGPPVCLGWASPAGCAPCSPRPSLISACVAPMVASSSTLSSVLRRVSSVIVCVQVWACVCIWVYGSVCVPFQLCDCVGVCVSLYLCLWEGGFFICCEELWDAKSAI